MRSFKTIFCIIGMVFMLGCSPRLKKIVHEHEIGYFQKNQNILRDWDALADTSASLRILLQTHNNFGSEFTNGHVIFANFASSYGQLPNAVFVDSFPIAADSSFSNYYFNGSTPLYNTKVPLLIDDELIDSLSIPPALLVEYSSFYIGEDSVIRWNALDPEQYVLIRLAAHRSDHSKKSARDINVSLEVNDIGEWKIPKKVLKLFPEGTYIDISIKRLHNQYIRTKKQGVILFSTLSSSSSICERN